MIYLDLLHIYDARVFDVYSLLALAETLILYFFIISNCWSPTASLTV